MSRPVQNHARWDSKLYGPYGFRRVLTGSRRGSLWLLALLVFGVGFVLGFLCASWELLPATWHEAARGSGFSAEGGAELPKRAPESPPLSSRGRSVLDVVAAGLLEGQNPPDCGTARYLILDELTDDHGLGFSLITLFKFLYVAHLEQRVLLFLPSFTAFPWRWCHQAPSSYACFFEESSYCASLLRFDQSLRQRVLPVNWDAIPDWKGLRSIDDQVVVFRQKYLSRGAIKRPAHYQAWDLFERKFQGGLAKYGRFFYYAIAQRVLVRPLAWLEQAAQAQRERWGLAPNESLVVVHARHGSKHTEQQHIPVAQLAASALAFCDCLGIRNILLITETQGVITEFESALAHAPVRVLYTEYWRPEGDVWNRDLVDRLKLRRVNDSVIDTIAYHSVLNLFLARSGVAFVGTIQSAFLKLLVSTAYSWRQAPVSIHSLRAGWRIRDGYTRANVKYWSFDPSRLPYPCAHVPIQHLESTEHHQNRAYGVFTSVQPQPMPMQGEQTPLSSESPD
ncbi:hypothetical protein CCYA_CCYA11G3184 [Cyanidiococcus yangmingshanensis]|nr:hypothetical protein CCYA_CCYA11G3184 [Cyanidiococcus yangmingshanensis]